MSLGCGVGDILAISQLAAKVYTAYKDAPSCYKDVAEEVKSLQIIIKKAAQHFQSTALSDDDRQEGQEILNGCQSVLKDLDSLIENYKNLASTNKRLVFKRVKLGTEDIATLRARLISNTGLLNSFILSCVQARLTDVLGLHRTNSRISITSLASFGDNTNARKAYKQFRKYLDNIGVTEDMIRQNEKEIKKILGSQVVASKDNTGDQGQLLGTGSNSRSTKVNLPSLDSPPQDLEAGSSIPATNEARDTEQSISTDKHIQHDGSARSFTGTAPHGAIQSCNTNIVELLLRQGVPIEAMDKASNTSLHLAAQSGHTDIVELLLGEGAPIDAIGKGNHTPLHLAAQNGCTSVVELLLRKGALIGAMNTYNNTPLHYAVWKGCISTVKLLLEKGASIEAVNINNNTSLHLAAQCGNTDMARLLLGKGASITAVDKGNNTPLHYATWKGCTTTVELLLANGVSVGAMDKDNNTAMHLAAQRGHASIVQLLLRSGALIQATNTNSQTPLHYAAQNGHTSLVQLLLDEGASTDSVDKENNTPLHLAAWNGHSGVVELLFEKCAQIEATNTDNDTPMHLAAQIGHTDIVKFFINNGARFAVPKNRV